MEYLADLPFHFKILLLNAIAESDAYGAKRVSPSIKMIAASCINDCRMIAIDLNSEWREP